MSITYKDAGVDIDAGQEVVRRIKKMIPKVGGFGGMFEYQDMVFVQSIDGVGTKMKLAAQFDRWETMGRDIVSHSCLDIMCQGATPKTFMDYIAGAQINPEVVEKIVTGIVKECQENDIALVGGETAEMPGVYTEGEYDLAGAIMGIMKKDEEITGKSIKAGDKVYGLASVGLHTNGYSLARKALEVEIADSNMEIVDQLLQPHQNYLKEVKELIKKYNIKGIAHITGGGFLDNIPRILPEGVSVEIKKGTWPVLSIFKIIQEKADVPEMDMYRTFNMGIGLVLISDEELPIYKIGEVVEGDKKVKLI
jgi:phosphoribosylformylglycinamidine cyclo-ligase